jgi:hypothetical protein
MQWNRMEDLFVVVLLRNLVWYDGSHCVDGCDCKWICVSLYSWVMCEPFRPLLVSLLISYCMQFCWHVSSLCPLLLVLFTIILHECLLLLNSSPFHWYHEFSCSVLFLYLPAYPNFNAITCLTGVTGSAVAVGDSGNHSFVYFFFFSSFFHFFLFPTFRMSVSLWSEILYSFLSLLFFSSVNFSLHHISVIFLSSHSCTPVSDHCPPRHTREFLYSPFLKYDLIHI